MEGEHRYGSSQARCAMSVYEFVCRDCKKPFQIVKPISQYKPRTVRCPKCHGKNVERVWSRVFVGTSKKS